MEKMYFFFLALICMLGFETSSKAQSLVVNGTLFLPQDSIGFTFESPSFSETDWIGIYYSDEYPGGPNSITWNYIPSSTGTLYLQAPDETELYRAFLLCCDGYDIIDSSEYFRVVVPALTSSTGTYTQGDSMVFSYVSPRFSATDWIGLYPTGTKPGSTNPSIDWKYIPDSAGTITFKTDLDPGVYDAYLVCCDGYDSISACTFQVMGANTPFIAPRSAVIASGAPIELNYNDPSYASGDWIGIYYEGDDPAMVSSIAWSSISASKGILSFPGTLAAGTYYAILFCCGSNETVYAESVVFTIQEGTSGNYVKTGASVYPENVDILVNYRNLDLQEKDWIGIYNKGDAPGGPESLYWTYITEDSGTVTFTTDLIPGEYVVYLLCCNEYNIKAKYNFRIADASTPSIVAASMTFASNDSLVFYYNSPSWVETDWIGIYNPGDVPGDIPSITWQYIPEPSGTMVFHYPDDHQLVPGEYWAGLLCCDVWDLYAQTSFVVTAPVSSGDIRINDGLSLYPNPSDGRFVVRATNGDGLQAITVYNLAGQVLYQEKFKGPVMERTMELGFLGKGMYILSARTGKSPLVIKLIIQ